MNDTVASLGDIKDEFIIVSWNVYFSQNLIHINHMNFNIDQKINIFSLHVMYAYSEDNFFLRFFFKLQLPIFKAKKLGFTAGRS